MGVDDRPRGRENQVIEQLLKALHCPDTEENRGKLKEYLEAKPKELPYSFTKMLEELSAGD